MTVTLVIVPGPTSSCPAWARWGLGVRAAASATGRCPSCGESAAVTVDPFDVRQLLGGLAHDEGCPAVDPRLAELGEDDVELRVLLVGPEAQWAAA